jgi:DNA invertase Pin-like site-specific DNA recombinase
MYRNLLVKSAYTPLLMRHTLEGILTKLIGYARVSTKQQSTDRQQIDLLAAGVRHDDLYVDNGVSGARASRPQFNRALDALIDGDTLVITTLDRLGRSTQNMLAFADELRGRGAGLRVLNLGGGDVDTSTPMGSMLFTIMAALAQMEHEIKSERIVDSISKRKAAGQNLGGRPRRITDSRIRSALSLIQAGTPATQVARDIGMSRATFYRRSRALFDEPVASTNDTER